MTREYGKGYDEGYEDGLKDAPQRTTEQMRQWVGLTVDEIVGCATGLVVGGMEFAKAIETKLKEKNT